MKQTNIASTHLQGKGSHWDGASQLDREIRQTSVDLTRMLSGWKEPNSRHRCSRAEVLSCPAEAEEWDKGLSEPPEPTA